MAFFYPFFVTFFRTFIKLILTTIQKTITVKIHQRSASRQYYLTLLQLWAKYLLASLRICRTSNKITGCLSFTKVQLRKQRYIWIFFKTTLNKAWADFSLLRWKRAGKSLGVIAFIGKGQAASHAICCNGLWKYLLNKLQQSKQWFGYLTERLPFASSIAKSSTLESLCLASLLIPSSIPLMIFTFFLRNHFLRWRNILFRTIRVPHTLFSLNTK